jgi:hypothetical protein
VHTRQAHTIFARCNVQGAWLSGHAVGTVISLVKSWASAGEGEGGGKMPEEQHLAEDSTLSRRDFKRCLMLAAHVMYCCGSSSEQQSGGAGGSLCDSVHDALLSLLAEMEGSELCQQLGLRFGGASQLPSGLNQPQPQRRGGAADHAAASGASHRRLAGVQGQGQGQGQGGGGGGGIPALRLRNGRSQDQRGLRLTRAGASPPSQPAGDGGGGLGGLLAAHLDVPAGQQQLPPSAATPPRSTCARSAPPRPLWLLAPPARAIAPRPLIPSRKGSALDINSPAKPPNAEPCPILSAPLPRVLCCGGGGGGAVAAGT